VLQREIDIAYVAGWRLPPGIAYEPLHRCEFAFMVSPQHPLAARRTVTAAEIDRAGIIAAPAASVESAAYASVFRRAGLQQYHIALEIDGVQSRILAARAGLGVLTTYLPPYAGEEDVAGLCRLRLNVEPATTEFGLVTRVGRPWGRIMHDFAVWLREASGAGLGWPDQHDLSMGSGE
jgi:DNA-binding transcriptional LysR family regulator